MKILQLVTKRQYRGAEVFAANLSAELIGFGHEIIFVGLYKNNEDVLEVQGAQNRDLMQGRGRVLSFSLIKNLITLLKKEKPDVVQCNGSDTLKYMVAASFFVKKTPITYRNISTISEWIDSPLKLKIYKSLFKNVGHVTSVGSKSIRDLIETLDYPEKQTSVIRRGISMNEVGQRKGITLKEQVGLEETDKIVMHIGNFSPEKNHEFLLDIFSEIKKEDTSIKLICIGNGVTFDFIKEQIKRRDLERTVYLLGFRKDIPELLSQANCFALASKIEGVPGVILEAASQKVPSVATNVGGVPEVLINNETGFIIDDFNKKQFKEQLQLLINDTALNRRMGSNAFNLVKQEFNPIKNARKFENLYAKLSGKTLKAKKKLKILQIIQKKQFRGAEIFASQLSNHLQEAGHQVQIVTLFKGNAILPFNGQIISLNRNTDNRNFDPKGWKELTAIISSFRPDIVQANASDTLKYAVMSKFLFKWNTPIVFRNASTPSFYIKSKAARNFNGFLLKRVNLIISVSNSSLRDLNALFPFSNGKSVMIPVGVEEKSISKEDNFNFKSKKVFNLLHIGSFTREKNHIGLLKIFRNILLQNSDIHLYLIGRGPLLSATKRMVCNLELESKVSFLGEIPNPQAYLKNADALVLPSLVEGLPGVILEAMYEKTPVVAYNVGGISEVIKNNMTGKLVEFGDEAAFCNSILDLNTNKKATMQMVENAETLIKDNFMNKDITQSFIEQYIKIS